MNIKKSWVLFFLLLIILIAIVVAKTFTYPFTQVEKEVPVITNIPAGSTVSSKSLQRFAGGIRIPTVSSVEYSETRFEPFDRFKSYLTESYPEVFRTMDTLTINKYGIVLHWKGKDSSAKPILFLSHYDVVPVADYDPQTITGDSTAIVFRPEDTPLPPVDTIQTSWTYPPFSGAVADGRLYGRGSLDMKCMLFSMMEAADALIAEGYQPAQDIWFAFGHDEEVGGREGACKIAQYFKEQNLSFDAVYDEGGIIAAPGSALKDVTHPLALVGLGEKGFLTLRIKVNGLGGHSSMPPAKSSLVYAAEIIEKLNNNQMQARLIPPVESFLGKVGNYMSFPARAAIANQWLLKPVLMSTLTKSPASNALVRTTTAITMAKGSDAPNVITTQAEITVNFRILQGETVDDVIAHVTKLCEGYQVEIENVSAREPSSLSPEDSRGFQAIRNAMGKIYPEAIVSAYITIGGTDAYKYQIVSDHIYRFMPLYLNQEEQRLIHNDNEYIKIETFGKMITYFKDIMVNY